MTIKEQIENLKRYKEQILEYARKQIIESIIDEQTENRFAQIGGSNTKSDVKVKVLTLGR